MSTHVATAHWRRLEGEGTDRCTLAQLDHGWLLSGQAIWRDSGAETALNYVIRCDREWRSLSAEVSGSGPEGDIAMLLTRAEGGWQLNGALQSGTEACDDIDLCFTPATNTMPLRRLAGAPALPVVAAWLVPDLSALHPLAQTYSTRAPHQAQYASPGFEADLAVHPSGFVTRYGVLWEGWVDG